MQQPTAGEARGSHWTSRVNQVILEVVQHDLAKTFFNSPPPGSSATDSGPHGPLCFAWILQQLMDGAYAGPPQVYADIQRMWAQCQAANPPGSEPSRAAERLAAIVDLLWRHMGLGSARQQPEQQQHQPQHGHQQQQPPAQQQLYVQQQQQLQQQYEQQAQQYRLQQQPGAGQYSPALQAQQQLAQQAQQQAGLPGGTDAQFALMQQQQQQQQQVLLAHQQSRAAVAARQASLFGELGGPGSAGGGGGHGTPGLSMNGGSMGRPGMHGGGSNGGGGSSSSFFAGQGPPVGTPAGPFCGGLGSSLSFGGGSLSFGGAANNSLGPGSLSLGLGGGGGGGRRGRGSMSPNIPGSAFAVGGDARHVDPSAQGQVRQVEQGGGQQQQQRQAAAAEVMQREQRRLALVRLKQELMYSTADPNASHPLLEAGMVGLGAGEGLGQGHGLSLGFPHALSPQLPGEGTGGEGGGGGGGTPELQIRLQASLAVQQQHMLEAMAQGQLPPPAAAPATQKRSLAAMLAGSLQLPAAAAQQEVGGMPAPADAPAGVPVEHERQRQKLALLKHNMLLALQQRHLQQQQQQGAAAQPPPQQQQQHGIGQQLLLLQQMQQEAQQQGAGQQGRQDPGLLSPGGSQQLASPTASLAGAAARRAPRQRPALAAQMGAAVKEAARAPAAGNSQLRQGHPLHRCLLVLDRLVQHEDAEPFVEPVDAEGLGLADYHAVIKRPMDLGTIRSRLAPGLAEGWGMIAYKSTDEVLSDVQLVWANCRRYNAAGSPITDMASRLERAFGLLWQEAGLGTAAAAVARPHAGLVPPASAQYPGARQHARTHSKAPNKQSPRSHGHKHSLAPFHGHGSKQAARRGGSGGSGGKRHTPEVHVPGPSHASRAMADPTSLLAGSPRPAVVDQQQQQEDEVAEEAIALERLLSTGGTSPTAFAAAAAEIGAARDGSPLLWEAPLPGDVQPSVDRQQVATAGEGASPGPHAAAGEAAGEAGDKGMQAAPADPFVAQWVAAGGATAAASLPARDSSVLLHPNRGTFFRHHSLPVPMMPQDTPATTSLLPGQHSLPLPPQQLLRQASFLSSGLAAATATVTAEQLREEQRVLAAWQHVQQQRQEAMRAALQAELAAQQLLRARAELSEVQDAEEREQQQAQQQQHSRDAGTAGTAGGSELTSEGGDALGGGCPPASLAGLAGAGSPREAAAAARSSRDLVAIAAAVRQARFTKLMKLGAQLFSSPATPSACPSANGGGGSSGSTPGMPGNSGSGGLSVVEALTAAALAGHGSGAGSPCTAAAAET